MRTLDEDQHKISIISHSILPIILNVSDTICRENQNTHFVFSSFFFFFENRGVYEIMWRNIVEAGGLEMTIWRMRFACWVPKATHSRDM